MASLPTTINIPAPPEFKTIDEVYDYLDMLSKSINDQLSDLIAYMNIYCKFDGLAASSAVVTDTDGIIST